MKPVLPGIAEWSWFSEDKQIEFNGHLLDVGEHRILVDPPPLPDADLAQLTSAGRVDYILLTNRDHEREAAAYAGMLKTRVYVPRADAPEMSVTPDKTFVDGELLPGGIWVVQLSDQKSPGESALFLQQGRGVLLVGDALLGTPAGSVSLLPDAKYADPAKARDGLRRVLKYNFDSLLVGDGTSIMTGAKAAVERALRGLYAEAHRCYATALDADRKSGDPRALAATLGNLGNICAVSGQRRQAQGYYRETLALQNTLGDHRGIGATLANLGNVHVDAGEWERGRAYYLEALDMMDRFPNDAAKAVLLSDLGLVAKETGQFERALEYYSRSGVLMRRIGNHAGSADVFKMAARLYLAWGRCDDAAACAHTSLAMAERLGDALRAGGAWYVLADCHETAGRDEEAARCLARVVRVDRTYGLPKLGDNTRRLRALRRRLAGRGDLSHQTHESAGKGAAS